MKFTEWFVTHKLEPNESWLKQNLLLETILGSHAYGCENPNSDFDVVCIIMPKPEHLWPQKYGYILGLDEIPAFRRKELKGDKITTIENRQVEIEWISIIEYFKLAGLQCSPNLVEVLFANRNLVTASSKVGWMLRDNRKLFLSAEAFHTFKHYASRQMQVIRTKKPVSTERGQVIAKYGYDVKMGYHVLRLIDEIEQLLTGQEIDLMHNREENKLMKNGNWGDLDRFERVTRDRLDHAEDLARKSTLPTLPLRDSLHKLLADIIEDYYGDVADMKKTTDFISASDVMKELADIRKSVDSLHFRTSPL
jgi:hypothetical protein